LRIGGSLTPIRANTIGPLRITIRPSGSIQSSRKLSTTAATPTTARVNMTVPLRIFDQAIQLNPTFAEALYNRGLAHRALGEHDRAAADFARAADRGLPLAQFELAICYGTPQGVPLDFVRAYKWFDLAAAGFSASENENRA